MSLVTDMLKKLQSPEQQGDVPPGLRRVMLESGRKRSAGKRYQAVSFLVVAILALGVGALYLPDLLGGTKKKAKKPEVAQAQLPVPVAPAPPVAQPAGTPEAPEAKPLPELKVAAASIKKTEVKAAAPKPSVAKNSKAAVKTPAVASIKPALSAKPVTVSAKPLVVAAKEVTSAPVAPAQAKQAPKIDHENLDLLLYAARSCENRRDYRSALENYRKALALDNDNYLVMNNMAGVLIAMGAFPDAAAQARRALDFRRDYVPALINLGIAQIKVGELSSGEGSLARALAIEPHNRQALLNLALLHERNREFEKAREIFSRLVALGDVQGNLGLARIAEAEGKRPIAARAYREASAKELDAKTRKMVNERIVMLESQ